MYNHLLYLAYWGANAGAILALGWIFPEGVALGVNKYTPLEAAVYSGFWLAFFVWSMWDFIIVREVKLEPAPAWVYFLLVNILGLWLIGRYPNLTGMRADGWWLVVLATAANSVQRLVWRWIVGRGGSSRYK